MQTQTERHPPKKVLCPVENKAGKTYWMRVGTGYVNSDGSTTVYLDAYPANGKLQIRDLDPEDIERMNRARTANRSEPAAADSLFPPRPSSLGL